MNENAALAWNTSPYPSKYSIGSMTTPWNLSLQKEQGLLYLCAMPHEKWRQGANLQGSAVSAILEEQKGFHTVLNGKSQHISLNMICSDNCLLSIGLLGVVIQLDVGRNTLTFNKQMMPLFCRDGAVSLTLVTDTHCIEIYTGEGKAFAVYPNVADYSLNSLRVGVKEGKAILRKCIVETL